MSKLFEAINRLEADTGQVVVESPFGLETADRYEAKSDKTWRKTLLLAGVIFIFALGIGFGLLFLSKKLTSQATSIKNYPFVQRSLDNTKKTQKIARLQLDHDISQKVNVAQPLSQTRRSVKSLKEKEDSDKIIRVKIPKPYNKHAISKDFSVKDRIPFQVRKVSGTTVVKQNLSSFMSNPLVLTSRQKRLLYRAEKFRKAGLKEQALDIYKKIWAKSHNPLVANNLAAMLMEKGQYQEAKEILVQAIGLSPDDNDLKFNLRQVKDFLQMNRTAY